MRSLGKVLLVLGCGLGLTGLFGGGLGVAFWGFADQYAAHYTYKVGFKHPGDDCGNNELAVDLSTGEPLGCAPHGFQSLSSVRVELPGFSDQQNEDVLTLSRQLGAGGFTSAEREQLQRKVDQLVASLPADRLPKHEWLWGWRLGVLGLLALSIPVVVVGRLIRRSNRHSPPPRVQRRPRGGAHR